MADTEREAFEKAMNDSRFFPRDLDFSRTKSPSGRDEYANSHLQSNWEGWQARAAIASRPAEVDDKIPRESNDALIALAKYWKLDGDWMTCKGCRRSLIASRDGEELAHKDGCKYQDQQHPWAQLRKLITRRPAPAGVAQ